MDLVSRHKDFYEKRDIEMIFAVTYLSAHKVFSDTHAHNFSLYCVRRKMAEFN